MESTPSVVSARTRALLLLAASASFAWHIWRFRWLCDDAFISMRYSRNLARGLGLVYNPGESPPVEGYTNFLWTVFLAPFEGAGWNVPSVALWTSATCGIVLVVIAGELLLHQVKSTSAAVAALSFLVAFPPLACWSTGGLETMPYTLALFGAFAALHGSRPRAVLAALGAAAAVLLRADGALFVALALAATLAIARLRGQRELARAAWIAGAIGCAATLAHVLWRHSYHGAWQPNTARAKVEFSWLVLERGFNYLATFAVSFPAVVLALLCCTALLRTPRSTSALASAALVLSIGGYAFALGGDFMAMGRFLVPALPFLAFALGHALARLPRWGALGVGAASVVLSLPMTLGVEFAPALRRRFEFRYSSEDTPGEFKQWWKMRQQAARWAALGRALAHHAQPGDSLMIATVGAVGYYSDLVIYDPYGLVSREEFAPLSNEERRSPGHQRRIPYATFLAKSPTFLEAFLVPREQPYAGLREVFLPGGELNALYRLEFLDTDGVPGVPPGHQLRLLRYQPPR